MAWGESTMTKNVQEILAPDQGGIRARMLVLLDNPSTKAEADRGSGPLELDNNDRTARNIREAYARYGVDNSDIVHWNVVLLHRRCKERWDDSC